jgi:hypothetical protein
MSEAKDTDPKVIDAFEPLKSGGPEVSRIITRVLTLETERLYMKQPHLNEDVLRIIKEEVVK